MWAQTKVGQGVWEQGNLRQGLSVVPHPAHGAVQQDAPGTWRFHLGNPAECLPSPPDPRVHTHAPRPPPYHPSLLLDLTHTPVRTTTSTLMLSNPHPHPHPHVVLWSTTAASSPPAIAPHSRNTKHPYPDNLPRTPTTPTRSFVEPRHGLLLTASPHQLPAAWWALRGAGPCLGVVTSLTLRMHPVAAIGTLDLDLPLELGLGLPPPTPLPLPIPQPWGNYQRPQPHGASCQQPCPLPHEPAHGRGEPAAASGLEEGSKQEGGGGGSGGGSSGSGGPSDDGGSSSGGEALLCAYAAATAALPRRLSADAFLWWRGPDAARDARLAVSTFELPPPPTQAEGADGGGLGDGSSATGGDGVYCGSGNGGVGAVRWAGSMELAEGLCGAAGVPLAEALRRGPDGVSPLELFDRELYMSMDARRVLGAGRGLGSGGAGAGAGAEGWQGPVPKCGAFKRCCFLLPPAGGGGGGSSSSSWPAAGVLLRVMRSAPSPLCYVHLVHCGGAAAEVLPGECALGSRGWEWAVVVTGVWLLQPPAEWEVQQQGQREGSPGGSEGGGAEVLSACLDARAAVNWVYDSVRLLLPYSAGTYGADLGPNDPRDAELAVHAFGTVTRGIKGCGDREGAGAVEQQQQRKLQKEQGQEERVGGEEGDASKWYEWEVPFGLVAAGAAGGCGGGGSHLRLLARLKRAADPGGVLGAGAMPLLRAEELLLGATGKG